MKMIALKLIKDHSYLEFDFPIVVRLREVNFEDKYPTKQEYYILKHIQNIFGLRFNTKKGFEDTFIPFDTLFKYVLMHLDSLNALLILDGFDEIPVIHQVNAFREIELICMSCHSSKVIITSRTQNFVFSSSSIKKFQIAPLKDQKIKQFAIKYLKPKRGNEFYNQLLLSPFKDTAIRPLILAFLITIFEHKEKLPSKPTNTYHEVIDILLSQWDIKRTITRQSKFLDFEFKTKREFLMDISYELSKVDKSKFTSFELNQIYQSIKEGYPSLPEDRIDSVLEEIEIHSGIFIKTGRNQYEFPHLSIQEYLAAEYIKDYVPISEILSDIIKLPYQSAMATTISKNPSNFFTIYMNEILEKKTDEESHKSGLKYLETLTELMPAFRKSWKFAYSMIKVYNEFYSRKDVKSTPLIKLFDIKGTKNSFIELEEHYKIADPIIYVWLKTEGRSSNRLIEIKKRNKNRMDKSYSDKLETPLAFIEDWKFIKSIL